MHKLPCPACDTAAKTIAALWLEADERSAFYYTEACAGRGRNGYDAWLQSGTKGMTFGGRPWHWDAR